MNKFAFLYFIMIGVLIIISCDRIEKRMPFDELIQVVEITENNTIIPVNEEHENIKEKEFPMAFEGIYFNDPSLYDSHGFQEFIQRFNEIKDFSAYETHPLDKFLGKWQFLDPDGNIHASNSYIEIQIDGSDYMYYHKYYSTIDTGRLAFLSSHGINLLSYTYGFTTRNIVGNPFEYYGALSFLLDDEGPVGYYQLVTEQEQ